MGVNYSVCVIPVKIYIILKIFIPLLVYLYQGELGRVFFRV